MASSLTGKNNTKSYVGTQSKVKNINPINELDRVNVYEFENGMDVELTNLGGELTSENIRKAQSKVLSNLKKDPAFYTNKIAEETIARFGEFGSGKKKKGKYTNSKDAEGVKADMSSKTNKSTTPYVDNKPLKGKYTSSGMEPLNEGYDEDKIAKYKKYTYTLGGKKVIPNDIDFYGHVLGIEVDGEVYRPGTPDEKGNIELKPRKGKTGMYTESTDFEDDKAIKDTMQRQVSKPIKSWDQIVADLAKDGKVKLTKENMAIISEEVGKMVKEASALKDKAGNVQYFKSSSDASVARQAAQAKGVQLTQQDNV